MEALLKTSLRKDDPTEEEFKRILMGSIKEKKKPAGCRTGTSERRKSASQAFHYRRTFKELVESGDDANKSYTEFKKLQQQWNETKLVPQGGE